MSSDQKVDTSELQALFDSIALSAHSNLAGSPVREKENYPELDSISSLSQELPNLKTEDKQGTPEDELEALFDAVYDETYGNLQTRSESTSASMPKEKESSAKISPSDIFHQIGAMTRRLHSMLRELGYEEILQKTASETIPDTRERLEYITRMTEQAAQKVLTATEVATPLAEEIKQLSNNLSTRWEKAFETQIPPEQFRQLALDTKQFLTQTNQHSDVMRAQLVDIMMAQDFQDLTGQVIKKVIDLAQNLENQLLLFLIANIPNDKLECTSHLMNGPVINPNEREDVVANQIQVDDLLESLGF